MWLRPPAPKHLRCEISLLANLACASTGSSPRGNRSLSLSEKVSRRGKEADFPMSFTRKMSASLPRRLPLGRLFGELLARSTPSHSCEISIADFRMTAWFESRLRGILPYGVRTFLLQLASEAILHPSEIAGSVRDGRKRQR